jgi:hypothetical protein
MPSTPSASSTHFADLLDLLNFTTDEHVSLTYWPPGSWKRTVVLRPADAVAFLAKLRDNLNICYGVNPTAGPARKFQGRGTADDATRLSSLFADLDNLTVAPSIVTTLSGMLGERPGAVVTSGHGWHPYWPIDRESAVTLTNDQAKVLLARFGLLVETVARHHNCTVDPVFDLARILRVPRTVNHKLDPPVMVGYHPDNGGPLTVEAIESVLDEYGIEDIEHAAAGMGFVATPGWWGYERWAKRGIDRQINHVEFATEHERNNTLRDCAVRCFRLALLAGYDLDDIERALFDAARIAGARGSHPHTDIEISATLRGRRAYALHCGPANPPDERTG